MLHGRGTPGPVEEVDGGVALPLRRGHVLRQALLMLTLGSVLLPVALQDDNGPMVVVGSVALAAGLIAAGWLLLRGADNLRIRLTADGLLLPSGWGTVRRFSWREIEGAQTVPRWQPVLVVVPKDDRSQPGLGDLTSATAVESVQLT